ncbi:MAG: Sua5/YciO/YrdC/YwlC family protein [Candidatus Peregrinibacteria bacterium GW2011_GWA2_43_8]|nr:MAG: Sua5/YciO/YrdC/YwlC family protein [Candidatus Peregrinibacteria bacterium GW2011_GWA2_43_8]
MVYSLEDAQKYGVFSVKALELASRGWPGDLTLIVPKVGGEGTVGIRIPGDDFTLEMLKRWGGPLTTTSANLSGGENPYSSDNALKGDYTVEAGKIPVRKPSTIMKIFGGKVEVIRCGEFV